MSLNPAGAANYSWNYSNPEREGYSLEIVGTIVSIQEVQSRTYNPGNGVRQPEFWPDGNPKMNIRIGMATADGQLKSLTFAKAGRKQVSGEKPSLHMSLYQLTNNNMMELVGKTVHIVTWPFNPNTNQAWGRGNPRLFMVEEATGVGPFELSFPLPHEFTVPELLADTAASGGAMQPQPMQPQNIQQPQQIPPMQYGYQQQQPMPMPMQPQQPMQPQPQQYQYQPPQFQQPVYQPQPTVTQPVYQPPQPAVPTVQQMPPMQPTAQMPQGMDPAVAQAMQAVGAQNVQPIAGYDDEVPF